MGSKSWDIAPSGPARRPASSTPQKKVPERRAPERVRQSVPTAREAGGKRMPLRTPSEPLRKRRKRARRKLTTLVSVLFIVLAVIVLVLLWQPFLRVQEVRVDGPNAEAISAFVKDDLQGSQFLLLPKSSIFILQQRQIREHILSSFPNVQAVSITPSGLTTLTIKTVERATAFWWCGTMYALPLQTCYQADTEGRIFAPVSFTEGAASSSMLWLFSPVATSTGALPAPLGSSIVNTKPIPNALSFVKAMKSLGANIVAVDIRGDEADLYTQAGTRITYVLGREEQAAALAATSFPSLKLNDGSLLYVDLRFDSKVFFKKKGKP